jgi:hypothetical protein
VHIEEALEYISVVRIFNPRIFREHVPNSLRNKNLKRLILNLLEKVAFLDPKRLLSLFCKGKNFFFINFVCYNLTNVKE